MLPFIAWAVLCAIVFRMIALRQVRQARRQLDYRPRPRPALRRVPPPPRMMLAYRELPAAVLATVSGRRTRARLRLIVAMRREQSLDRYYQRLGRLPDSLSDPPARPRPARVKTPEAWRGAGPDAFEDPVAALTAAIVMMFTLPPPALTPAPPAVRPARLRVVHLKEPQLHDLACRAPWDDCDYVVAPVVDGHPDGIPCGVCDAKNATAAAEVGWTADLTSLCAPGTGYTAQLGLGRWTYHAGPSRPGWMG
jgi:hypothetical protein